VKFTVLSLFPEILEGFFASSIMAKSIEKDLVAWNPVQIRDFAFSKHRNCDDLPYGGGAGMVLKPEPLSLALESVQAAAKRVLYVTPGGRLLTQQYAEELAREPELVIICGRYEGIDQRIIDEYVDDEVSIGDYVLSSGETAALVIIDAIYRLLDGVINQESLVEESHSQGLLEYPHYTRPEVFRGREVPKVLLSGHHAAIKRWRLERSIEKTMRHRPELIDPARMGNEERKILAQIQTRLQNQGGNHGPDQGC
jgi:tRNA (guanine37-N1)-methyltransferase